MVLKISRLFKAPDEGLSVRARLPPDPDGLIQLAESAAKQGDAERALELYDQAIQINPNHALVHFRRANLLKDQGHLGDALASYDHALALKPDYAHAYCNRGVVLQLLDRFKAACESYDRAIALAPDDPLAHYNRASVLRLLERPEEALASYDRAIALNPGYVECHCNRGILLLELKRWEPALTSLNRAIALKPDFATAYFARGNLLSDVRRDAAAVEDFDRVVALEPTRADAFHNRANVLLRQRHFESAVDSCDRALALRPNIPFLRGIRRHAKMHICDWHDLDSDVRALITGIEAGEAVSVPFPIVALLDDARLHRMSAQIWVRDECSPRDSLGAVPHWPAGDRIRIGYFSSEFHDHAVSNVMAEVFERHDRSRFEVTAFSLGPPFRDPMRERLEAAFERFIDVGDRSDRDIALLARSLGVDIAVDLTGHTGSSRTKVFALRAAPIQINYLGYPGTMGAEYIDYLIGDRIIIPPSQRRHYAEKIVYLPHSYLPHDSSRSIDETRSTRTELGLPETGFVFCCFNNSYKITPGVFDSWMRILAGTEDSVLWLSQHDPVAAENLRREAAQRGIDSRRLLFADRIGSVPRHLSRLRAADLFLDTRPYNAHATAMDALWAGVPLLTCAAETFAGRVAASLLTTLGLPELITSSPAEYEATALQLAASPERLVKIKEKLAQNRLASPLFDTTAFTRHIEAAYEAVEARHRAGLSPDHIYIPATMRRSLPHED
jgi:predicted O-linked N-acetylglucosamine transferase (SPINDLY family)